MLTRLALTLEVLPFTLAEPPFALGFNYSSPKDPRALAAHLQDMRAHGMTTVAPLHSFHLPVHDEDTREFVEFIQAYQRAGFRQPIHFGTSMNLLVSLSPFLSDLPSMPEEKMPLRRTAAVLIIRLRNSIR